MCFRSDASSRRCIDIEAAMSLKAMILPPTSMDHEDHVEEELAHQRMFLVVLPAAAAQRKAGSEPDAPLDFRGLVTRNARPKFCASARRGVVSLLTP